MFTSNDSINCLEEKNLLINGFEKQKIFKEKVFLTHAEMNEPKKNNLTYPIEKYRNNENTFFLIIIFILVTVLIIIKSVHSKFLEYLSNSLSNYKISKRFFTEKNITFNRISMIFDIFYYVNFSLYIYLVFKYLFNDNLSKGINIYLNIFIFLSLYLIFKNLLQKIVGFIFDIENLISEYIFHKSIINKWIGIILLPFIFILNFSNQYIHTFLIYISFLMIFIFLIIKISRSIKLMNENNIKLYHGLIYFSIFELVPLILIYKFLLTLQKI